MAKQYSIDQLSTETLRRAQAEMALMRGEMRKLRHGLSNMDRGLRTPKIRTKRTWTKKTRESASLLEFAAKLGVAAWKDDGSFEENISNAAYRFGNASIRSLSQAQSSSAFLTMITQAQRVR